MGKAKKTDDNKPTQDQVEARPQGQGKDPLAEGNTLVNPTNTEAETHYDVKQTSEQASQIDGQDANERAEQHNNPEAQAADDTPEQVEVPERTEEQEEADGEERQDAMAAAIENEK